MCHLYQQLNGSASSIDGTAHEHDRRVRRRVLEKRFQPLLLCLGCFALTLWDEELLRFRDDHDTARRHHGQRAGRVDERIHLGLSPVHPFHVEGAQILLNHLGELRGDGGFLEIVGADQHVERIGLAGGELFAKNGRGENRHPVAKTLRGWR